MVWNATVANLTLMALGSSAPEILLSVIETVTNLGSTPGELGPSTIVGSAAFNLLVISGVSILAVEDGTVIYFINFQTKKINDLGTFIVTAVFSIFAYIWLFLVLLIFSKGVVEMWEAILTLAFFFIFIIMAYTTDKLK